MLRRAVISCHNGKTLSIKANHSNSNILCIQALLNFHSKNINVSSSKDDVDGLGVPESISPQGVQGKLFSADSSSICNLNQQWMSTCLKKLATYGEDCTQFKIWLENCYKLGDQDCIVQYQSFRAGR